MELKRVVVTGMGALTPVGNTAPESWENLKKGVSGAAPITHFDASKFKSQFACEVKGFKATDFIDRKEVRKMDLYEQYAVVAAMEAVKDSGMDLEAVDKNRIGVVLGVGIGGAIMPAILADGIRPRSWNILAMMVAVEPTGSLRT